jgi:hypothetical protein
MRALKSLSDNDRVRVVNYDVFTSNPQEVYGKICSFIDVGFEEEPLKGGVRSLSDWTPDPYLAKPITPSTKDWRDFISENEASAIERELSGTIENLGMQFKTSI